MTSSTSHTRIKNTSTGQPQAPDKSGAAFASASNPSSAEELLGRLVAYRPIEVRTVETRLGISEATYCQLLDIEAGGSATDLGERPIFWQIVRQQLAKATKEVPWIAGRLMQSGQAYHLEPLTPTEEQIVGAALASLSG